MTWEIILDLLVLVLAVIQIIEKFYRGPAEV